jgi:ferritin-like protein
MIIMSTTTTIAIQVDTEVAKAFAEASPEEQRKMQLLLSLRLQDLTTAQGKSLQTVMDEVGARAEARGLTPEILKSLLDDE